VHRFAASRSFLGVVWRAPYVDECETDALPIRLLALVPLLAACGGGTQRGEPLTDPRAIASAALNATGTAVPVRVVFEWEYADDRGRLRGDGASRVNPPDRFRLDLYSTAEGSMRAALVDGDLTTSGQIEDVQFPPATFLYAMTGVFRPGPGEPIEGFRSGDLNVLGYPAADGGVRYFYFNDGRLDRVEERRGSRMLRRIVLAGGGDPAWPREARYRDDVTPKVVRWELVRVIPQEDRWPEEIYDISPMR
jgi:hypothetical protein